MAGGAPRWIGDRRRRASGFLLPMEVRPHLRQGFNNLSKKALSNIRRALMVRVVSHLFWKIFGLEDGPVRRIITRWRAIYGPPNISAVPIAVCLTPRQRRSIQSGSFSCDVCGVKVHTWSGLYDFFDWKVDKMESPMFGKRWG